tara:strand:+ start:1211 stop:2116 length:906 start_codon:yes stop_codon:yes gene_type:complete
MTNDEFSFNFNDVERVDLRAAFDRFGIIHIRSALSEKNLEYFLRLTSKALKSALKIHRIAFTSDENDIDALYNKLFFNPAVTDYWKFVPKTLAKNSLVYHRLLCEPGILEVTEALIGHDHFQLNWDQNLLRVDRPNEGFAAFEWHQDHPYILLSETAISVWAPLTDVTQEMGPLKFVPGSHHGQFHPVIVRNGDAEALENYNNKTSKHRYIELANSSVLAKEFERDAVQIPMKAGDALFFHSHLVHRSGQNDSDRSRWVFVARYGDLLDAEMVGRGWATTRGANPDLLRKLYPDRVVFSRD